MWCSTRWRAEAIGVLELEYLRDLKVPLIAGRSLQEMRRGNPIMDTQAERWSSGMRRLFPDVKSRDRMSGQHLPGRGARFWHNGRLGEVTRSFQKLAP
jgi:hypothetical protein